MYSDIYAKACSLVFILCTVPGTLCSQLHNGLDLAIRSGNTTTASPTSDWCSPVTQEMCLGAHSTKDCIDLKLTLAIMNLVTCPK